MEVPFAGGRQAVLVAAFAPRLTMVTGLLALLLVAAEVWRHTVRLSNVLVG